MPTEAQVLWLEQYADAALFLDRWLKENPPPGHNAA
jgi:hypothetical protein